MNKYSNQNTFILWLIVAILIIKIDTLASQCGIQFCSSCDPIKKTCYQCDFPYKPGYVNQTICTRCANNCAVCQTVGTDSKGRCLSCMPNFNYASDDHCDTFYIWIYVVVIACYAVFIIIIFTIFCFIKRRKERKSKLWFQNLKLRFNQVDTQKVSSMQFQKMCESLEQLLKQSSSYNNLKFKDREYEKAIKIKTLKLKQVKDETHLKYLKMKAVDNSEWQGMGYVLMPSGQQSSLKIWFVKNYINRVYSEQISKIIIYESKQFTNNQIKGIWYYLDRPEIKGTWSGIRQLGVVNQLNPLPNNE